MIQKKTYTNFFIGALLISLALISSCTSRIDSEYRSAVKEGERGNFRIAVSKLEVFTKKYPDHPLTVPAAKEAARISQYEIKDFSRTIGFLKLLILKSKDQKERIQAQEQMAQIYFDNLQNYKAAINEFNRLKEISNNSVDKQRFAQMVAKSNYYLGNFPQTLNDIDEVLKNNTRVVDRFSLLLLKANTLVAIKDFKPAIAILEELRVSYPEQAKQEGIALSIAICFEEIEDFKKAIEVLEAALVEDPHNDYLLLRIKRLKERLINKPGSKGMHK